MRMTFKRGFISGMITISAFFGLYMSFFNHPPPAETLEANAHHSGQKLRPPKFSDDFGPPKANSADSAGHIPDGVKKTNDKILRDQGTLPKDEVANKSLSLINSYHGNYSQKTESTTSNLNDNNQAPSQHTNKETLLQKPQNSVDTTAPAQKADDAGSDVRDGIQDGVQKEEGKAAEIKPGTDGGSMVFAHRDFPIFDWGKWVEDNDLVSVGTIWGYCDEPEPPEIGQILLMKDEDNGGLKIVIVMNTTFDEPVETGTIVANVLYGETNFFDREMDICTLFEDDDLEPGAERDTFFDCPMAAGIKYYTKDLRIPFYIPSGHYTAKAKLVNQKEQSVICTTASVKL